MIPAQGFFEVEDGKDRKNGEGDDFLDRLELGGRKFSMPEAVGRDLETIFKKGNQPAGHDHQKQGRLFILQMAVPGEGHKDV